MTDVDLTDLQAFVAVGAARSFRTAAGLRGVSASSLSEAVRRLEGRLGVRLLNRTTRSVTPTEAGTLLLERLGPALGGVAAALDALNGLRDSPSGTLRLNVPSVVARMIMPPVLGAFMTTHPAIRVDVTSDDTFIDVLAAGFDAGVRYDERLDRDMIAIPIGPRVQRFVAAASPAYLRERGRPSHPRDLLDHACIRHRFASGITAAWDFERDGEVVKIDPAGRLVSTAVDLEVSAAVQGLGCICMFEEYLRPALDAGALEIVLPDWLQSFPGPFLYYASRRHMPAPLRAFVDFIKARGWPIG